MGDHPLYGRRLAHVTTVPESLGFVAAQIDRLVELGVDVHAISSPGAELERYGRERGIEVHGVPMTREITPVDDLRSLLEMTDLLLELRPDIVHAHTPKAGLIAMLAATAARVPVRIYHMRGLLTFTAEGLRRGLLASVERTSCALAARVICQSPSLRRIADREGLCSTHKSTVLLGGSNGVDARGRFNPARHVGAREEVRVELGIPEDATVVGFVGRLVGDKGINELAEAWPRIRREHRDAHLLVVGPFEARDPVPEATRRALQEDPSVHLAGFRRDTERLYAAMDLLALPTYREGFPNVPMEAAAMEVPTVATEIPGCVDAVVDGETGALVPVRDADALAEAIAGYLREPMRRRDHGRAARERVLRDFDPSAIADEVLALYADMIDAAGIAHAPGH